MLSIRFLILRINDFVKRLFWRGSESDGVPPVGVREPIHRSPNGRGGAIALSEPEPCNRVHSILSTRTSARARSGKHYVAIVRPLPSAGVTKSHRRAFALF